MKNMYIDFSVLAYRNLFSMKKMIDEFGFDILRHVFIKNIIAYIRDFEPDRVYIAIDVGKSWRKKLYTLYKGKRKESRDKQDVDWESFFEICNNITNELKENFPFYVLGIDSVEADDIIAHLVITEDIYNEKIIITSDKDYVQLLQYPNTKLYDPIRNKYIKCDNPLHALEVKICSGDTSDNIPSIAPRWGEKTAEKHILSGKLQLMLEEKDSDGEPCEIRRNYERNQKLIDMSMIPKSIIKEIELAINDYKLGSHKGLLNYFMKSKLNQLLSEVGTVRKYLDKLT